MDLSNISDKKDNATQDIHTWFGLSYASYLVVPRCVLQSMPEEWQHKMTELLDQMNQTLDWKEGGNYFVIMRDDKGRYMSDQYKEYRRKTVPFLNNLSDDSN